eukprot:176651-Ditylum_brightwellii.AAC.1
MKHKLGNENANKAGKSNKRKKLGVDDNTLDKDMIENGTPLKRDRHALLAKSKRSGQSLD